MGEPKFSAPLKSGSARNPFYKPPEARQSASARKVGEAPKSKPDGKSKGPDEEESEEEEDAARRRRVAGSMLSLSLSLTSLAFMNAARHEREEEARRRAQYHAHQSVQEQTATRTEAPPSVRASGFEHIPGNSVTNANVGYFESAVLGSQNHMPLQLVRMGNTQQGDAFVNGEASHYDTRAQAIVVNPDFFQSGPGRSSPDAFYGQIALREGAHVFDWDNAPGLSPLQREQYKNAFVQHILRHTPRVSEHFRSPQAHLPWQRQVELRAKAYQQYLAQTILSLPVPNTQGGVSWDEAMAEQLHETHHLPIVNARFEVALFRYMIQLTFPCRTPEAMHGNVQQALANIGQQAGHRINTTTTGSSPSRHRRPHHS